MGQLTDRVAIVTGAATGLGRATAVLYAAEGAQVVVADVLTDEGQETVGLIRSAGGTAVFVRADVRSEIDVKNIVSSCVSHFGTLHIMTANAGIHGRGGFKSIRELAAEELDEIMAVNFRGVFLCFKHAVPLILESGGGAMTATASLAAHRGYANLPAYSASKGAVVALIRSLAVDLAPKIRVNAVSPGAMLTDMRKHYAEAAGLPEIEPAAPRPSSAYLAEPINVAQAHLFLASDASAFITGQTVVADGGRSLAVPSTR